MLKKVGLILMILLVLFSFSCVFAETTEAEAERALNSQHTTDLLDMQESTKATLDDYIERYGSKTYGFVAMILAAVRIYSIPFCFIGIVIGSVYQYVIGIRKLDVRDKGFGMIITFVTILLICQVLPLIFAIVVNGWRG